MNQNREVPPALIYVAWTVVALPLAWGIYQTLIKVAQLFS